MVPDERGRRHDLQRHNAGITGPPPDGRHACVVRQVMGVAQVDFLIDLSRALLHLREAPDSDGPNKWDACDYHLHKTADECTRTMDW